MSRAHSFPRTRNFAPAPRNFNAEFVFLPQKSAEFDVFHSNNYFFRENDLKVARVQVCL